MKTRITYLFLGVCLAAAQESRSRQYTIGMPGTAFFHEIVTGKPFSAKRVNRNVQTLIDGTHITDESPMLQYRDTMGRTRLDQQVRTMEDLGFILIEIDDPVAGYHYTLDALDKVAYRVEMTQTFPGLPKKWRPAPNASCVPPLQLPARGELTDAGVEIEDLGTRTMEGLPVEGVRSTTKTPAGLVNNDMPLTHVQETWFSTYICGAISNRSESPQGYESISELTDISTAEPDSSLFQIPPDYKIVDKTGPFQFRLIAPARAQPRGQY